MVGLSHLCGKAMFTGPGFRMADMTGRRRLFCFPFAGGGRSIYRNWQRPGLPMLDIVPVDLPGHESRYEESLHSRMDSLVTFLSSDLEMDGTSPFAFFGYSMGALVAFELTRLLQEKGGPLPVHLFLAAHPAAHITDHGPPSRNLSDEEFIGKLVKLGGMPSALLASQDYIDFFLPIVRADFELLETWEYSPGKPVDCPITAFGGSEDRTVPLDAIEGWRQHTNATFACKIFPGNHFFIRDHGGPVLAEVAGHLLDGGTSPPKDILNNIKIK